MKLDGNMLTITVDISKEYIERHNNGLSKVLKNERAIINYSFD